MSKMVIGVDKAGGESQTVVILDEWASMGQDFDCAAYFRRKARKKVQCRVIEPKQLPPGKKD